METRALLSQLWLAEHQEQPPLATGEKFRISDPCPRPAESEPACYQDLLILPVKLETLRMREFYV